MNRALGRLAFLLLFHLSMVASGYACANPSMTMGHDKHGRHHQTPSTPVSCTTPASCAPAMAPVARIVAAPTRGAAAALPAFEALATVLDPAAPDTPPPRV